MAGLKDVVKAIKAVAMLQPAVNSAAEGSPYDIWNGGRSIRYASVVVEQRRHSEMQEDNGFIKYHFYLVYGDRLLQNLEQNRLEIQSNAMDVLRNIIWTIQEQLDWDFEKITYTPFEQKFADELAGAYADVEIIVPLDWLCPEEFGELTF